jgi:hypothetical protein
MAGRLRSARTAARRAGRVDSARGTSRAASIRCRLDLPMPNAMRPESACAITLPEIPCWGALRGIAYCGAGSFSDCIQQADLEPSP